MNLLFWRRRRLDEFAEAIQPELQALETPEPGDALLNRILASRADGTRIILPAPAEPHSSFARVAGAVAVATALILLAVSVNRRRQPAAGDVSSVPSFFGAVAFAQSGGHGLPVLPPVQLARPRMFRPLQVDMVRRQRNSAGQLTSEAIETISVTPVDARGTPAWRVTDVRPTSAETLYIARADLRMLSRAMHVAPYHRFQRISIQQHFQRDSVTGRMTTAGPSIGAGRAIARSMPPRFSPYLSDGMAPLFFMSVPLSAGWNGSASLLGWAVLPTDVFLPINLRVVGEELVRVPAGEFDCWRLSVQAGERKLSYWVRKSDGLAVRLYDDSEAATRGIREIVLRSVR